MLQDHHLFIVVDLIHIPSVQNSFVEIYIVHSKFAGIKQREMVTSNNLRSRKDREICLSLGQFSLH